jgi:hypothetical protein
MKKIFKALLIFGTITLFSTTAFSQLTQFIGSFKNINASTPNITKIEITRNGSNVRVQVWGKCTPADCDWGVEDGFAYGDNINSNPINSARTVSVIYRKDFAQTLLLIRPLAGNRLQVETFTRFTDNSGRASYSNRETFMRDNSQTSVTEDCLDYNPNNLQIRNEGATGWLLTDGSSRMLVLDNQTDARNALALAKRHTSHCFIGRGNRRSDRQSYIVEYWKGNSGINTNITNPDCISYNPSNLSIRNEGANGWLLTDGSSRMFMLDNRNDATLAKQIAESNSRQCFIGRNNTRPNRQNYIVNYWQ